MTDRSVSYRRDIQLSIISWSALAYDSLMNPPDNLRHAGPAALAAALDDGRAALLQIFDGYRAGLGDSGLQVPCAPELNPPLWEMGHIGWFEEHWLGRNPQRSAGNAADPLAPRAASLLPAADTLYDSSRIEHDSRWKLPLPDVAVTLGYLAAVREQSLALLSAAAEDDAALYFFRLALFHEAMHREAWTYMAQTLDIALPPAGPRSLPAAAADLALPGGQWTLGYAEPGFAFDNELPPHPVTLDAFAIDRAPVSWARYLPFVAAGGYGHERYWTAEGWGWCHDSNRTAPRYLRQVNGKWQQKRFGTWQELDPALPAMHLSCHEAQAWCVWAGRRLPTEAEWEMVACSAPADFAWGEVWEWTASTFEPYPGFIAHPYRDYSVPWFGSRPVLRGASFATAAWMKHPRYRNYFTAERNDIFAGFRSCAK